MQDETKLSSDAQKEYDRCEINDFKSYHIDSIKIAYHSIVDTIYGYRKEDTLQVEGDILMNYPPQGTSGVATTFHLWKKKGTGSLNIPYVINPNYNFPDRIENALQMWMHKLNNDVQFVKRTFESDYIEFIPSKNTRSYIGRVGGRQIIELADWAHEGNIAHEIGHLLGLYHEQSRLDRDKYVRILCSDDVNYRHAFKVDPHAKDFGSYNYYSIMHYPPSNCLGIRDKTLPRGIPGQRDSIAKSDYTTVKNIYGLK
jgi:hypothetical protein